MNSKGPIPVVYVIAALVLGGAEKQLYLLLENLDHNRFSPLLVTFYTGPWEAKIRELGIKIKIINYNQNKLIFLLKLIFFILKAHPKVVHTYGQSANFFGRVAAILSFVPSIIISERSSPNFKNKIHLLMDRILAPFAKLVNQIRPA